MRWMFEKIDELAGWALGFLMVCVVIIGFIFFAICSPLIVFFTYVWGGNGKKS